MTPEEYMSTKPWVGLRLEEEPRCEARVTYTPRPDQIRCERSAGHAGVHSNDTVGLIWPAL